MDLSTASDDDLRKIRRSYTFVNNERLGPVFTLKDGITYDQYTNAGKEGIKRGIFTDKKDGGILGEVIKLAEFAAVAAGGYFAGSAIAGAGAGGTAAASDAGTLYASGEAAGGYSGAVFPASTAAGGSVTVAAGSGATQTSLLSTIASTVKGVAGTITAAKIIVDAVGRRRVLPQGADIPPGYTVIGDYPPGTDLNATPAVSTDNNGAPSLRLPGNAGLLILALAALFIAKG